MLAEGERQPYYCPNTDRIELTLSAICQHVIVIQFVTRTNEENQNLALHSAFVVQVGKSLIDTDKSIPAEIQIKQEGKRKRKVKTPRCYEKQMSSRIDPRRK